jgi:hypothetical protein
MTKMHFMSNVVIGSLLALAGCAGTQRHPMSASPSDESSSEDATNDASSDGNPLLAYDKATGSCVPYNTAKTSKADYDACVAMMADVKAKSPAPTATVAPKPVVQSTMPRFAIPVANGPICDLPTASGSSVTIYNDSDFYMEVLSSDVAPLNCDAWRSTGFMHVTRPNGTQLTARVIAPHESSEWAYAFAMNGSVPQLPKEIKITFVAYRDFDKCHDLRPENANPFYCPALGTTKKSWSVSQFPRGVNQHVWEFGG